MLNLNRCVCLVYLQVALGVCVLAKSPETSGERLSIDRIYADQEFSAKSFSGKWLDGEAAYTTVEDSGSGNEIVRHDAASGETTVLVSASDLVPPGEDKPLTLESYAWSKDKNLLLVYTNSKRVWRRNTRGDYWVLDRSSRQLQKIGGGMPPSSLMFAKFSPNGKQVAFVHEKNIYLEDLHDNHVQQLTFDGGKETINGTTDWVYEEELDLRDAFRWSPDGRHIAYWQFSTKGVPKFPLINHTDSLYPTVRWFAYPKVGQRNSSCRIGVVSCDTNKTQWIALPGDPREHYVARLNFLSQGKASDTDPRILIQQLNRLQNTNRLFLADFRSNVVSQVMAETDAAWVDIHDALNWINGGSEFTWLSERSGWRHLYIATLDGALRQVTHGEFDVIDLLHVDEARGQAHFIASPDSATERYLYRIGLDGSEMKRITPAGPPSAHSYQFSTDGTWATHVQSAAGQPPITSLIATDNHQVTRVLEKNETVAQKLAQLPPVMTEFFRVDIGDGIELDAWCIRSANLDPKKKHPLLVYVYGEPAGSTVVNAWSEKSYLWHRMLAEQGYVVMSFDNRGTKAPRGRQWRKSVYQQIGILPPHDQAAAVQEVLKQRDYLDPERVGIWGWSGGGSSSLHAIFKYPQLYSTAIAIASVPNQRYYDTIYQERYMSLPELNVEGFREGSAINFAKNLTGNLLLVHGTGDDNCHYQTMELLVDELIAHNKQFSMMSYPNRTHSIRERKNTTRHLRQLMTDYLHQHLPVNECE